MDAKKVIIYIVTDGSYSSKHNVEVYSIREEAEKLRDYLNSDTKYPDADIEEFELDPPFEVAIPVMPDPHRKLWHVVFKKDTADIIHIEISDAVLECSGFYSDGGFFVRVKAETQEAAAKIAMERRSVELGLTNESVTDA